MDNDCIVEIGIDAEERLYIKPSSNKFPYIYREAMDVHWGSDGNFLYGAKLRKWSYLDWYNQIIKAAIEQSCKLTLCEDTIWVNIPEELKNNMRGQ